jgi:uncharacterized C2H2 Zn-finger protein
MNQTRECPLCSSKESKFVRNHLAPEPSEKEQGFALHDEIPRRIVRCPSCGMVFVSNSDQVDMSNEGFKFHKPAEATLDANYYSEKRLQSNFKLM